MDGSFNELITGGGVLIIMPGRSRLTIDPCFRCRDGRRRVFTDKADVGGAETTRSSVTRHRETRIRLASSFRGDRPAPQSTWPGGIYVWGTPSSGVLCRVTTYPFRCFRGRFPPPKKKQKTGDRSIHHLLPAEQSDLPRVEFAGRIAV